MKIKIKYVVKWFIALFPLILVMIFYIKNGEEYFSKITTEVNFLYEYFYSMAEVSIIIKPISRILCIFFHPDLRDAFYMFECNFFFEAMINMCFSWFIAVLIMWEFGELISRLWHKLMRMEEE